jgi:hypothetical protein
MGRSLERRARPVRREVRREARTRGKKGRTRGASMRRGGHGGGMDDEGRVLHAQIPTSFGPELRACLRCRLIKTYDQVPYSAAAAAPFPLWFSYGISQGKRALCQIGGLVHREHSRSRGLWFCSSLESFDFVLGVGAVFFGQVLSPMAVMLFPLCCL